ncbi:MAG: hypothetical protein SOW55_06530 [Bacilli bacterium]|nr:hypothetical protein [Bacilli bacterium]
MSIWDDEINVLDIENILNLIFILASLIEIEGNNTLKKKILNNISPNGNDKQKYLIANILILFVFIAYVSRNYHNVLVLDKNDPEYKPSLSRLIGSIIIVIGEILVINYFLKTTKFNKKGGN